MKEIDVIQELKSVLPRRDITQGQLASMLDVSSGTMSRIMNGMQPITPHVAARIAKAGVGTVEEVLHFQYLKDCAQAYKVKCPVKKNCLK